MDSYFESLLLSISNSLKSASRSYGPKLFTSKYNKIIGGENKDFSDFAEKKIEIKYNITPPEYYEYALKKSNNIISSTGALIAYSGKKTGRSPLDRRIVQSKKYQEYFWKDSNSPNIIMNKKDYDINRETAICFLDSQDLLFVFDGYAGWDTNNRIKVRVITSRAYHAMFMNNMLIRPTKEELLNFGEPDYTILNSGVFPCNRYTGNMTSSTSVDINFDSQEIVILGTQYAGEMKKAIFSVMNFIMPLKGNVSLHSSCNTDLNNENPCIFFGLSGTGKTTLSAASDRKLIGDDEHIWADTGVSNIEGGCYAKIINLNAEKEPEIFNAIKFGTILENVNTDCNRSVLFEDSTITQNTRASYPIEYINTALIPCVCSHPKNIILLTCDAFGVLPPVSKLSKNQAMYHFINGYTAKIAGTEIGIKEPIATFSACYGEAFIVWHPLKYAELLAEKMDEHNANCWLVNTGWVGGKYGVGNRCDINITKQIVKEIQNGNLSKEEFEKFNTFNIDIPKKVNGVPDNILNPENSWNDINEYKSTLNNLARLFIENSKKYDLDKNQIFKNIITL